jgi:PKD repeat protein
VFNSAIGEEADTTVEFTEPSANYTLELVEGPTTITQNESYSATLQVTNEGDAAGNQTVSYVLEDESGAATAIQAEETGVELDAGNSTNLTFDAPADATAGLATGNYTHVFSSEDDELTVDAEVVEEETVPPVTGDSPPTNLDDDAQLEDVNGNGELDIGDVQALYDSRQSDAVQNNVESFDFNNNDGIDIGDIQALYNEYEDA